MKKICIILAAMLLCLAMTAYAEPAENAEALSLVGVTVGDTYENAMFGIGCKLEGWTYSTAEEIAQINQVAEDLLGEKAAEMLKQGASLITMLAKSPNALQNVNFQASDASQLKDLFETYGFAAVIGSSTSVYKQQLEEAGFTDVECSATAVTVGGQDFPAIYGEYKLQGILMYYKQFWMVEGDYMASFTITTALQDSTDDIVSCFYLLPQDELQLTQDEQPAG